jgi:hypothetical protein
VRSPSKDDRRVKILEVTKVGQATFSKMEAIFANPPAELLDAPREYLLALVRIAERLAGAAEAGMTEPAAPAAIA